MNRIATTFTLLSAFALSPSLVGAEGSALEELNSRLKSIEARLSDIEKELGADASTSYSYQQNATLEATNGVEKKKATEKKISAPPIPSGPVTSTTYVIKEGDTLGSIAREHSVGREDLLKANRLSEGQPIYIGETLLIPGAEPESEPIVSNQATSVNKPEPAKKKEIVVGSTEKKNPAGKHVVVKGDTLTSIARVNDTTVAKLKKANGLNSDVISLGQMLTLPAPSQAGSQANAPEMTQQNTSAASEQGMRYEYENPLLNENETYGYYTVRKGDNLYALARDFFTTMAELQRINRLGSSTLIYPGNELIVPTTKYNDYHNNNEVAQR
ncbi:MAG: LysM peptidoglycan-binding domain-containing protein [Verrucomicrobiota bacterium]